MNVRTTRLASQLECGEAFLITSKQNVFYYSGFDGEGILIIEKENAVIVTDFRYIEAAHLLCDNFEIRNIADGIENIIKKNTQKILIEESDLTLARYRMYQKKLSWAEFCDGGSRINAPRLIKDASEIAKIKAAAKIAEEAFVKVLNMAGKGISERSLALEFEHSVKLVGASALSFDTIVASGANSSMPHAGVTDKVLADGDLVTMDFGCVYEGYCSDMTRTFAVGTISNEQKEIYEIVRKAQAAGCSAAVSGAKCSDVDKAARDIIKENGYGDCFGHALGHGVGLEIHEEPRLSAKSDTILCDGMVVTCEPGIYLEGKFGVRIEDLLVINGQNCTNLSNFTKELIII